MAKKLKKNGFIDGTFITYISVIFTKILGALYIIPFTAVIGENGMVIYSCAYLIYNLVLNASTSGIPTAMSILISEHNTKGLHKTKMKYYRVGMAVTMLAGFLLFLLLEIFAGNISSFYISQVAKNTSQMSVGALTNAIRSVGFCLLVVPFLSIFRGFLQGQRFLAVSSYSQVIEQISRIAVVLAGAYIAINVLGFEISVGVNIALLGAGISAAVAAIYLKLKAKNSKDVLISTSDETDVPTTKYIIKRFLSYSIPVFIVAISGNVYDLTDNMVVVSLISGLGYKNADLIGSIISTYGPKISMIVFSLSIGLTNSIVPAMAAHVANKEFKEANKKLCTAVNIILGVSVPMSMGIFFLSDPIYAMFYGKNGAEYGGFMLKFIILISVVSSIKITLCMAMQGLKKTVTVCVATITGILVNIGLDYALILLFYHVFGLGEKSYIGAFIATFIGQMTCILIILVSLRKSLNFRYGSIFRTGIKILIPTVVMSVVVGLLQSFLPVSSTRGISQILHLCVYAAVGGIIYLALAYKSGALVQVFGENTVNKVLSKLHLKNKSI